MRCLVFSLTALACCAWAGTASAANPYRDRHFTHYSLHDDFDLQDFNRHSYAAKGYPATTWSYAGTLEQVKPIPPVSELPPVPLPPEYEWRRRDYEYYRQIMPGSPGAYAPPPPPSVTVGESPSDVIPPWRSRTAQPGHSDYAP